PSNQPSICNSSSITTTVIVVAVHVIVCSDDVVRISFRFRLGVVVIRTREFRIAMVKLMDALSLINPNAVLAAVFAKQATVAIHVEKLPQTLHIGSAILPC